ncbi:transposase [Rhizobium leguminosarum bv. viciae]|nr:transposase [Rhizobium leguminosarum bv. viciae]
MSIRENPTAFINPEALQLIMTADELDLPRPENSKDAQPLAMTVGQGWQIYSPDWSRVGRYVVQTWSLDDRFGALVTMGNVVSNSTVHLTTSQLVFLEKHRRLRPAKADNKDGPGAAFKITPEVMAKSQRYLGYVQACLNAAADANMPLRRGMIEAATARHAVLKNESKPPSYNTIRGKIEEYRNGTFDPVAALAPKTSAGNRTDRFCDELEEILADAIEKSWRLKKGDWRNVREFFLGALQRLKYQHLRSFTHDAEGCFVRPSDRTLQRRFGSVDRVQRTIWRHGIAHARAHLDINVRQALPDHPLDVVDVDFTPIDVIVIDDEHPIIYGRPHLLAFRDRKTGSLLGYSISFKGATFEAFLEALKMAIMPKDMSAYPGLEWIQYGTFVRLGVDNDMALINDHVRFTLTQLGIQLVEYRPGHPWEKGAVERLFRILNQDLVHNLPGATMSNVVEREKFLEVNEDVPKITLRELNDFMIHYIADYHRRAHDGLGLLRTLSGVPNKLWADGIRKAKSRRPVDPDVLTRALGNFTFVTIQDGCVRWDNLVYAHPDLIVVAADARNRTAVAGVATTEYQAWRDPGDLEYIYLLDHHNDRVITVPVQSVDRWYAKGLRLYQHQMVMKYLREQGRDSRDFAGAFESFSGRLAEINKIRTTKKTRQALARFHARASKKFIRSRVVEVDHNDPSGAAHMELVKNATGIPEPSFFPSLQSYRTGSFDLDEPVTDSGVQGPATKKVPKASPPAKKPKPLPQQKFESDEKRSYDLDLSDDVDDISSLLNKKDEAE